MGTIDIHTHLPARGDVTDARNLPFLEKSGLRLGPERPIRALLDELDRGAIDRAVVLGSPPSSGIAQDNDEMAAAIRPHADRLIGFGCLDPRTDRDAAGTVRRMIEKLGFRGVGELGYFDFTDPACFPVYETCIDLGVPCLIHLGTPLPSAPLRVCHPMLLDEVVIRYPELRVIAAHCGAPWFTELAAVAVRHPNVWIDVSALGAYPKLIQYQAIGTMLGADLGGRLLFGSDFPVTRPSEWARFVRRFDVPLPARALLGLPKLTPAQRAAIMEGNARTLLRL